MHKNFFNHLIWISSIVLAACTQQDSVTDQLAIATVAEVSTLTLSYRPWHETIEVYGIIQAAEEIDIRVDFSEPVKQVLFKEGQKVYAGQVLIKLDDVKRKLHLEKAKTDVADAKATLDKTRSELLRRRKLALQQTISQEALDTAEITQRRAAARFQETLALLSLAERELKDSVVLSPANGVIEKRLLEPGEITQAGQTLAVLQALDTVRVKLFVSEKDINYLRQGEKASLTLPAIRGGRFTAVIETLGIKADPETGNFPVTLSLDNQSGLLKPGMTARIRLQGFSLSRSLLIPDNALVDRNRRKVVYIVKDDRAREVEPLLRMSSDQQIPILGGLEPGDELIISGLQNVIDGTPLEIIKEQTGD